MAPTETELDRLSLGLISLIVRWHVSFRFPMTLRDALNAGSDVTDPGYMSRKKNKRFEWINLIPA